MQFSNLNSSDAYIFIYAQQFKHVSILNILDSVFDNLANVEIRLEATQLSVKNTTFSRIMQNLGPLFDLQLNKPGQDVTFEHVTVEYVFTDTYS